ncbi:MAG: UDP-N-acetylmuramate dehydrogenase [Bacteroidales bacterium]|nr:UDP-N-acetylmuramate dehydrogenase [Bacteroidales bacterium]
MIEIQENAELFDRNTFHVAAKARYFVEISDIDSVNEFLASDLAAGNSLFILGGGSNVLFTGDFDGVILHPAIKGIDLVSEGVDHVVVRAGAGENWDDFVDYCVRNNWGGIENLSLIPGTTGASPVQNIGAYGVEVMDFIDTVEGLYIKERKPFKLKAKDCRFSYRNSIFKTELKGNVIITRVSYRLRKKPLFNTRYPDLEKELNNYDETTVANIRKAIITIRTNKLPDPAEQGNAGSFFKNPVVTKAQSESLKPFYPTMPEYNMKDGSVKLSAAWLIDQCGWKGRSCGKAATHKKQPLIIINRGGASGKEIYDCAQKIQKSVMNHFAIRLEMEVNIV